MILLPGGHYQTLWQTFCPISSVNAPPNLSTRALETEASTLSSLPVHGVQVQSVDCRDTASTPNFSLYMEFVVNSVPGERVSTSDGLFVWFCLVKSSPRMAKTDVQPVAEDTAGLCLCLLLISAQGKAYVVKETELLSVLCLSGFYPRSSTKQLAVACGFVRDDSASLIEAPQVYKQMSSTGNSKCRRSIQRMEAAKATRYKSAGVSTAVQSRKSVVDSASGRV